MAAIDITAKGEPERTRTGSTYGRHHSGVNCYETTRGWRYQPACTCGYRGAARVNPNDASHVAENHVYATDPYYRGRNY